MFYNGARKAALKRAQAVEEQYNSLAEQGNRLSLDLYSHRKLAVDAILRVEAYINALRNSPVEFRKEIAETIQSLQPFREAMRIEKEAETANLVAAGTAAGGAALGGSVAALGPTAAMAKATTFGTASTGAAISGLTGAAATNAALAWLGGGALAAGGGGMTAGNALLALAGPVGWGIAALAALGGGTYASLKNREAAEQANSYAQQLETKRAEVERLIASLTQMIDKTIRTRQLISVTPFNLCPTDWNLFSREQKLALGALVNNSKTMGTLINERIG